MRFVDMWMIFGSSSIRSDWEDIQYVNDDNAINIKIWNVTSLPGAA